MKKTFTLILLISGLLLLTFFLFTMKTVNKKNVNVGQQISTETNGDQGKTSALKTFSSSNIMNFTIQIPSDYKAVEVAGSVSIYANSGEIHINRNGTNFADISAYVDDLTVRNNFTLTDQKKSTINGLKSVVGMHRDVKDYFIYIDNVVYTISTNSEDLYDDLDQIAQSFQYIPRP